MSFERHKKILCDTDRAGVYRAPKRDMAALLAAAKICGFAIHRIDLSAVRDKTTLMERLAAALKFPDWFGHNWDALADCLSDLSWLPAGGHVLLLEHCDDLHAAHTENFVTALQVFAAAADTWRAENVPFWVLIDVRADTMADFPEPR